MKRLTWLALLALALLCRARVPLWAQPPASPVVEAPPPTANNVFPVFTGFTGRAASAALPSGRRRLYFSVQASLVLATNSLAAYNLLRPESPLSWWIEEASPSAAPAPTTPVKRYHPTGVEYDSVSHVYYLTGGVLGFDIAPGRLIHLYAYARDTRQTTPPFIDALLPVSEMTAGDLTVTDSRVPPSLFGFQPGFPRQQKMESGSSRTVVPLQLNFEQPSLTDSNSGRLYFETRNALSTETQDISTQIEAGLGFEGDYITPDWRSKGSSFFAFLQPGAKLRYLSSQSFSNQSLDLRGTLAASLPGLAVPANNLVRSALGPLVTVTPLWYTHRLRRNLALIPAHAQYDIVGTAAEIDWQPIYLFVPAKRGVENLESRFAALKFNGKLWVFYNERAVPGYKSRNFETRGDVELQIPLHLGSFTPFKTWLIVFYGDGANEANGFARSTQLGGAIRIADFRINL